MCVAPHARCHTLGAQETQTERKNSHTRQQVDGEVQGQRVPDPEDCGLCAMACGFVLEVLGHGTLGRGIQDNVGRCGLARSDDRAIGRRGQVKTRERDANQRSGRHLGPRCEVKERSLVPGVGSENAQATHLLENPSFGQHPAPHHPVELVMCREPPKGLSDQMASVMAKKVTSSLEPRGGISRGSRLVFYIMIKK